MRIRRIALDNFMGGVTGDISFPEAGIVLITGKNGSGKSSIIEAVSSAFYGKTLRGTPYLSRKGKVCVETDKYSVCRESKSGKSIKLSWERQDNSDYLLFESAAKAQQALLSEVMPLDVWQRSFVFSSQDASKFTTSSDSQRKYMLECVLGINRFDAALALCRSDKKSIDAAIGEHEYELQGIESKLSAYQDSIAKFKEIEKTCYDSIDTSSVELKIKDLEMSYNDVVDEISSINKDIKKLNDSVNSVKVRGLELAKSVDRLNVDRCPTCGQRINEEIKLIATSELTKCRQEYSTTKDAHEQSMLALETELCSLTRERDELRDSMHGLRLSLDSSLNARKQHDTLVKSYGEVESNIDRLEQAKKKLIDKLHVLKKDLNILQHVELVLGVRGARASMLSDALDSISIVANKWLSHINSSDTFAEIELKPYSTQKNGSIVECISFDVHGFGGGFGYAALSSGERRRIDIAMLFALSEFASNFYGVSDSTIFIDEALDTLDVVGVEYVCEMLRNIAKTRLIVIITHNQEIVSLLNPDMWLNMVDMRIVSAG